MNENFTIFVIPFIEIYVPHHIWFFQVDIKLYK